MTPDPDFTSFQFATLPAERLSSAQRERVLALFHACYRQANAAYLERSLENLGYVSLAERDGETAGFALGDARVIDLPRLPRQLVVLAGLCCVLPEFRRHGLFMELERHAVMAAEPPPAKRVLNCGRMAHPAAFRTMSPNPGVVPARGVLPTAWQREVGQAIAGVYGVHEFDPQTFVCKGSGAPIGYPVIEVEVAPEEWEVFRAVSRGRGDSLLGIAWSPSAPPGW